MQFKASVPESYTSRSYGARWASSCWVESARAAVEQKERWLRMAVGAGTCSTTKPYHHQHPNDKTVVKNHYMTANRLPISLKHPASELLAAILQIQLTGCWMWTSRQKTETCCSVVYIWPLFGLIHCNNLCAGPDLCREKQTKLM